MTIYQKTVQEALEDFDWAFSYAWHKETFGENGFVVSW